MRYILASNNNNKLQELRCILSDMGAEVVSQREAGLTLEVEETGETFEENALIKAHAACQALGEPAIADDSGLVVDALNGEPGVYSARYGGESCHNDTEKMNLILKNMEHAETRSARFVSAIVCVFPNGDTISARGKCEGVICLTPRGTGGFGYDPIFEIPHLRKTMAELMPEEKHAISHRGDALRKFEQKLRNYYAHK